MHKLLILAIATVIIGTFTPRVSAEENRKPGHVFEGIGVQLNPKRTSDGWFTIENVMPMAGKDVRASLKKGDRIIAVDGDSMRGKSVDELVKRIGGPAGTSVRLTIRRPNAAKPIEVKVARKAFPIQQQP
jgi:carboxyl-terminal processing protease